MCSEEEKDKKTKNNEESEAFRLWMKALLGQKITKGKHTHSNIYIYEKLCSLYTYFLNIIIICIVYVFSGGIG